MVRRPEVAPTRAPREAYVEMRDKARHNVRFGSLEDISEQISDVCLTP